MYCIFSAKGEAIFTRSRAKPSEASSCRSTCASALAARRPGQLFGGFCGEESFGAASGFAQPTEKGVDLAGAGSHSQDFTPWKCNETPERFSRRWSMRRLMMRIARCQNAAARNMPNRAGFVPEPRPCVPWREPEINGRFAATARFGRNPPT